MGGVKNESEKKCTSGVRTARRLRSSLKQGKTALRSREWAAVEDAVKSPISGGFTSSGGLGSMEAMVMSAKMAYMDK